MVCVLVILVPLWIAQSAVAVMCAKKYHATRLPACALLVASPIPVVAAVFGPAILSALHTPSSFDAVGDGFEILFKSVALVIGAEGFAGAVCVWLSLRICSAGYRRA